MHPHGGRLETATKLLFAILLLGLAGNYLWRNRTSYPDISPEREKAVLAEAQRIRNGFVVKGGGWTANEIVTTRNRLIELRDSLPPQNKDAQQVIQAMVSRVVYLGWSERPISDSSVEERARTFTARRELEMAFNERPPGSRQPIPGSVLLRWLRNLALGAVGIYVLFIPFALACMITRLRKREYSISDELVYGYRNLLISCLLWPIGLGEFPRDTAKAIRRRRIEIEFRARLRKSWWDQLSSAEEKQLDELVLAPKAQLQERLEAIAGLPAEALWRARFALYASMVAGALLAPFSAKAQERNPAAAKPKDTTGQVAAKRKPIETEGHMLLDGDLVRQKLGIGSAFVIAKAHPHKMLDARLMFNLAQAAADKRSSSSPVLLDASGTVKPWAWPLQVTFGQFLQKSGYLVPAPFNERLIGGPLATGYLTLRDIGVEVNGTHGWFSWAVAGLSGAGKNVPDNNSAKDILGWMALGPFGPLRFQFAWQAGQQPEGFRQRHTGNVTFEWKPFTLNLVGAHQSLAGAEVFAVSYSFGLRAHKHLDLAAGYDAVLGKLRDRWLRSQMTLLTLEDQFRIGLMYGYRPDIKEHSLAARVQIDF